MDRENIILEEETTPVTPMEEPFIELTPPGASGADTLKEIWKLIKSLFAGIKCPVKGKADAKGKLKGLLTKKNLILAAIVLAVLIVLPIAYDAATNTYMTPVKLDLKLANTAEYDVVKAGYQRLNGLGVKEWKQINRIMAKSEMYQDAVDELQEDQITNYEYIEDFYGENPKFRAKVMEKTELSKKELREYRDDLRYTLEMFSDIVEEAEDYDSSDWGDMAENLDLTKAETKKLVKEFENLVDSLGRLEVTEGYELEMEYTISSKDREEPYEMDATQVVLKVNGRWITANTLEEVFEIF